MLTSLIPTLAFVSIGLIVFFLGRRLVGGGRNRSGIENIVDEGQPALGWLTRPLAAVLPLSKAGADAIELELRRAGHYRKIALREFLANRNALVLGWLALVAAALVAAQRPLGQPPLLLVVAGIVGCILLFAVPRLWLQSAAARRTARLQAGLPDALDMITMCLTGGLSLQQSFERVGKELRPTHPDFALELEIVRRQADAHSLEHALAQFSARLDIAEIKSLSALVTHTERLGTNVAGALRDYADGIRTSIRQRAEERGNRASVALLLPVVFCLAPPVYILLLAPAMLELRDFMVRENRSGGILSADDMSPARALDQLPLRDNARSRLLSSASVDTGW